jgi:exonuclease SbcC
MKPLRLDLTAFGPFGGTEVFDFTVLPEDRPFVIGGCTGAGKTTIFDATTFALYGRLPGRRSSQKGHDAVRSDFADPALECSVRFEFEAHAQRWRVTRVPAQERRAKRGDRTVSVNPRAVLEHLRHGAWVSVISGVKEVERRCEELVGLGVEQFQRVVLLPQGEFARVLDASTDEREELLRTLFGTAVFADAVDRLKSERRELGTQLSASDQHCRGRLERVRVDVERAASALGVHSAPPPGTPTAAESAAGLAGADETVLAEVIELDAEPEGPLRREEIDELAARVDDLAGEPLAELRQTLDIARANADRARSAHRAATSLAADVAERERLVTLLAELGGRGEQVEVDRAALHAATASDPVIDAMALREDRRREAELAVGASERALAAARPLLVEAGCGDPGSLTAEGAEGCMEEMLQARVRLEQAEVDFRRAGERRAEAAGHLRRGEDLLRRLGEDRTTLADLRREVQALEEHGRHLIDLSSRREAAELRLREVGSLVERLTARDVAAATVADAEREVTACAESVAAADHDLAEAERARAEDRAAATTEPALREELRAAEVRLEASRRLADLQPEIVAAEAEAIESDAESHRHLAAFVGSAAGRLAAELQAGEPCPVCGSAEHPRPAEPSDGSGAVTLADVELAGQRARDALVALVTLRQERAELVDGHPGLADDELCALEELVRSIGAAAGAASSAGARVGELDTTIGELRERCAGRSQRLDVLRGHLGEARVRLAGIDGDLGSLGDLGAQELRSRLVRAEEELGAAESAREQLEVCRRDQRDRATRVGDLERSVAAAEQEVDLRGSQRRAAERDAEAAEASARRRCPTGEPAQRRTALDRAVEALRRSVDAGRCAAMATSRLEEAVLEVDRRLAGSPFDDEASAAAATMPAGRREEIAATVERWQRDHDEAAGALRLLAERDLPEQAPALGELDAIAEESELAARLVQEALTGAETHLQAAREELEAVRHVLADDEPVRDRCELLGRVHSVLSGRNGEQRITLETWVLRRHLAEVVDAANLHLHRMSHGRFQLALGSAHVRGQAKAGLDLVVFDAFSGRSRRTTSLSGGETFQASLSMALGLADVLTSYRAGCRVDALFVDEGFGSLDTESVEQAISVLDGLRSRGSMVGLITHVEAMKEALEVVVEVEPRADRRGSTIRQRSTLAVA